jgi:hypothetical protein
LQNPSLTRFHASSLAQTTLREGEAGEKTQASRMVGKILDTQGRCYLDQSDTRQVETNRSQVYALQP